MNEIFFFENLEQVTNTGSGGPLILFCNHLVDTNAGRKFLKKSTEKITNKIGLNLDVGPIVTP
jgi:hypothetical protein